MSHNQLTQTRTRKLTMKFTLCRLLFIFLIVNTGQLSYAQYRNGFKKNGIIVAGGSYGSAANQLANPDGICIDSYGNLYVADTHNNRIQKFAPGAINGVTVAGGNGPGSAANQLNQPCSICLDTDDNLYVADFANNRIQKFTPRANEGITIAGRRNIFGLDTSTVDGVLGIFIDHDNLYISVSSDQTIKKMSLKSNTITTIAGGNGAGRAPNQLSIPATLCIDSNGNLIVLDYSNNRVQKFAPGSSQGITIASDNGKGATFNQLNTPTSIFTDIQNNLYIADAGNNRIQKFPRNAGQCITVAGGHGKGSAPNQFDHPEGICLDNKGNLYVSDWNNNRVLRFDAEIQQNNPIIKPMPDSPVSVFTSLDWKKPVSDLSDLPGGIYSTSLSTIKLRVRVVSNKPVDRDEVHLLVNGEPQPAGDKMHVVNLKAIGTGSTYDYEREVTLSKGISSIAVECRGKQTEQLRVNYQPDELNLYVLAIGTNNGLSYAVKDAKDIATMFGGEELKRYYGSVMPQLLTGPDATAINISSAIGELQSKDFKPNDVLLVYISSHGMMAADGYRLLGSDFKTTVEVNKVTVNFQKEVLEPLEGLACKKFIFLDACYSGGGIGDKGAQAADISREVGRMVQSGSGITIMTSSSGMEKSWEDNSWANGAFTKAIKEGLEGHKADTNGDGLVSVQELYEYVQQRVPALVKAAGKRDSNSGALVSQTPKLLNPKGDVCIYVY